MVDKGPLLTSGIIFYLSIGAAIFQILEEPNWKRAVFNYTAEKERILNDHPCLKKDDLDRILKLVSGAASQGITIVGNRTLQNWDWRNAVVFSATVITTIGYGNIAPKTARGRIFCVIYGLFGIPLCLTWISELGKFFGSRARRFGEFLIRKGLTLRKAQFTCTAIFLLWGLVVHLLIPPFVYMYYEGWSYVEGFYFSFVTLTTIGFGDLVTAVDPNAGYPVLYCFFVQLWICLGLAWLSLFFNWNVHMVVEAHKALKKRRRRHLEGPQQHEKVEAKPVPPNAVDIFSFLSEKHEGYSDHIKHIGEEKSRDNAIGTVLIRSKSCSDNIGGMRILTYDRSLRRKRRHSFSEHLSEAYARRMSQVHSDVGISQDSVSIQLNIEASEEGGTIWATKENQPLLSEEDGICPVTEENLLNSGDESGTRDSTAEEKAGAESSAAEERSSGSEDLDFDLVNSIYYSSREQLVKDEDNG
ncbi:potassium channel subfamily K member 5-like isoform X2 [Brienomyrus brachyistius]|uniref:potassium channel subfamily K member 5-like isoform X2 n=1 Tax=Brienomyrus brachyistius TaxID=42636 RepID=UPI0020B19653|nr:potassium channel subfamily K member 5-like isoform X2 [Brienomyrus brachyistius]